jgi:basic amino acid/polyamine antiporter, APA family
VTVRGRRRAGLGHAERVSDSQPGLARRLGTGDAVVVGLSAMIGAGVFAVFAPAAEAAGGLLLVGLGIAALVAFCNAVASAQLAQAYPTSGGTYVYGRVVLGPWWGFVAGWGFVVGKTASCAAMAMTFAAYAVPDSGWAVRGAAVGAVLLLTAANLRGVTRTALVARVLLTLTLLTLLVALVATYAEGRVATDPWPAGDAFGVLQSAGLLFFAFAGYARIATLGEEVRRPELLGRAILIALGVAVALYAAVGVALLLVLGNTLPDSTTPLATAVDAVGAAWAEPVVRVGAAAASLGALLALLAGVGRTSLAMARERDLPRTLAHVHPAHRIPDHAQIAIALAIIGLVLVADLRGAIGFSSCGVLIYYAVANLAAFRQPPEQRRWPRALNLLGLVGCVTLVVTLPAVSVAGGLGVIALGVLGRWLVLRRRSHGG